MRRPHVAYSVQFGLAGCYMPDSSSGPMLISTRRELAALVRDELAAFDLPAYLIREVHLRRLWQAICHAGSASSYHFSLHHGANALTFCGLTTDEVAEAEAQADY